MPIIDYRNLINAARRNLPSEGSFAAGVRGFADPFNYLDEMGAVPDTLIPTEDRENIWQSDRPWKDILYENIDKNRAILEADARDHPLARGGGQIASNLLITRGRGLRGRQLLGSGVVQSAASEFGGSRGDLIDRAPAMIGGYWKALFPGTLPSDCWIRR